MSELRQGTEVAASYLQSWSERTAPGWDRSPAMVGPWSFVLRGYVAQRTSGFRVTLLKSANGRGSSLGTSRRTGQDV